MDNVTHTLIGVGLARALPRRFQRPSIYWAAVLGNNAPDVDVPILKLLGASRVDSLIHHRGHSHTFLLAIPLGLLIAWAASRIGKEKLGRDVAAVGIVACMMHVLADFMNSYGVHPFAPFWNHWIYGDSVFIVEPWLWFALLPLAYVTAKHWSAKTLWSLLFAAMLGLVWFSEYLLLPVAVLATAWGAAFAAGTLWTRNRWIGISGAVAAIAIFFSASAISRARVREAWTSAWGASEKLMHVASSPDPANPFCFRTWTAADMGGEYRYRHASVALLPGKLGEEICPAGENSPGSPRIGALDLPVARGVRWELQVSQDKREFELVREKSCKFRRMLGFFRFPILTPAGQDRWDASDLRFGRGRTGGRVRSFAESEVALNDVCDSTSQPWVPPFGDGC